jgi:hypothetical protein
VFYRRRVKQAGGCLRLERPVGQLSARGAERAVSRELLFAHLPFRAAKSTAAQTNKRQAHKKEIQETCTIFLAIFICEPQRVRHSLLRYTEELAYQINWRIDPAADEIDADMRASIIVYQSQISGERADGFCVFYVRAFCDCVVYVWVLRAGRNPILLSSHIWFINMRAARR